MSADKVTKSPDISVSSLSGRTDKISVCWKKSRQNPNSVRNRDRHNPDRQLLERIDGKSGEKRDRDRTRTVLSADVWHQIRILDHPGWFLPSLNLKSDSICDLNLNFDYYSHERFLKFHCIVKMSDCDVTRWIEIIFGEFPSKQFHLKTLIALFKNLYLQNILLLPLISH